MSITIGTKKTLAGNRRVITGFKHYSKLCIHKSVNGLLVVTERLKLDNDNILPINGVTHHHSLHALKTGLIAEELQWREEHANNHN